MSSADDPHNRANRAAKNQSLFRAINERVKDLNVSFSTISPVSEWICECANDTCTEKVPMSMDDYEAIRADPARFFVAPNDEHVWADVESVTNRNARYWIVEKDGEAARVAAHLDPRSAVERLPLKT